MTKHICLKLILILHFLPWPGGDLIYFALFPAEISAAKSSVRLDCDAQEESSARQPVIVHHGLPNGESLPVYCEAVGEAKELETEGKGGRDDDSQELWLLGWTRRLQQIASLTRSVGFQSEYTMFDYKRQSFLVLRC